MSAAMPEMPPPLALLQLLAGKWGTQAIAAAVDLGLPDRLDVTAPRSAAEIAAEGGFQEAQLYRLLRALAGLGVLAEHAGHRFTLTPIGFLLRKDANQPFGPWAGMLGSAWHNLACAGIAQGVRSGRGPFELMHGKPLFEWMPEHPEAFKTFYDAMTGLSSGSAEAVFAVYDFTPFKRIVDVGGGHGQFLARILQAAPAARGVLFDLPAVSEGAKAALEQAGVGARAEVVGGDFFSSLPAGADAYVLKHVVHDWGDEECVKILRRCAEGLAPGGRVLVLDMVMPPAGTQSFHALIDLEVFIMTGTGRERTEQEMVDLLTKAGLKLERVLPTPSLLSIVEASRA